MALSQSISRGQSEIHKSVDIKDIGNESEIDFTNLKCKDHSAFCCLFCKSCDQLVCPTGMAKGHMSHDLIEISEAYQQKLDGIKETAEHNNGILRHLKTIQGNLEQLKSFQSDQIAIEEEKKEEKLISDLKFREEEVLTALNKDIETIKGVQQIAQAKHEDLTKLKTTNDANKFFQEISKKKKSWDINIPQTPSILMSIPKFVPKDLSHIGGLQREPKAAPRCDQINLQIEKQYQSELAFISYTCPCTDGSLWIGDGIDDTVHRVRPDNTRLKVISNINTRAGGMASTESGDLLICTGGTRLQQISCKSGEVSDTRYDVAPLVAIAVHITQEGKVIVGGDKDDIERRAVVVMDTDGRHERVYEHDNHGKPLFTYPLHLTSTSNGHIHVVDLYPYHFRGRLLVLSQGGGLINIYSGHPDVNKVTPFCPVGITATPGDNVMVMDLYTMYLHLLDNTGHILTIYDTDDAGIQGPCSLAFASSGSLWVGCGRDRRSKTKNAKLYHVAFSGC